MTKQEQIRQKPSRAEDTDWWRGAVIYQIYPRSFQDSNGDGIGDLPGITERLGYIAELGVDAIWISPFFTSPMLDFGYDVSDYCDVDPMFGSLADFDALIARAHSLGLKVLIDQVLSHSSDQHAWFKESRRSCDNPKADWYVWADPKPDGSAPNNWLSIFGGPAWEWEGERQQYYLHNFLREQPDLNLHTPAVQDALLETVRFWLDRGVDGFRLDTINFYFHSQGFEDNPALAPEDRDATIAPAVNPYNWQNHLYDKNQPENLAFLRRFRALLNEYPGATAVGEVGDAQRGTEIQAEYTSGGDKVQMCYAFDMLSGDTLTGTRAAAILERFQELGPDGWACWAYSNHDVVRHSTRWDLSPEAQKLYAALLMSVRGSICLYQGEELGLTEAEIEFDDLQDPYGIRFWPKFKGRDGCRTPMVWQRDNRNGGFTEGKAWLPVAPEHLAKAAAEQAGDPGSMLSFYKQMLRFRERHPVLAKGSLRVIEASDDFLCLERRDGAMRLLAALNLSDRARDFQMPEGRWAALTSPFDGSPGHLPPWQAFYAVDH